MGQGRTTINNNQFRALLVCTMWPTVINYGSGMLARQVGRDMWISGAISMLNTLILAFIIIGIGRSFPNKTIIEYSQELLWVIPGKLLGLLLAVYFLIGAANTVSMYIHHLTDFLLPETPFLVVTVLHTAVVMYLVSKGPEAIARLGVIGFALAVLFHILVLLASLSEVDLSRLKPFMESGVLAVYKAGISLDSFTGFNQMMIGMLLPIMVNQKKAYGTAASGLCIGGSFYVFYFIAELMVMGPQVVALMRIASMDFVRSIQITQYLHRFESFMVALWYWSMLVQAGISAYCSLKALIQTLGIKKEKSKSILTYIYGIAIVILTFYIANDRILFLNYRENTWRNFALSIQYGIPVILLLALAARKVFHKTKSI
ncbi:MAG: endospore germination permease [Clostridiaceae bacterium]